MKLPMFVPYSKVKVFKDGESSEPVEVVELIPFKSFDINVYNYNGTPYNEYLDNELKPCIRLDLPA